MRRRQEGPAPGNPGRLVFGEAPERTRERARQTPDAHTGISAKCQKHTAMSAFMSGYRARISHDFQRDKRINAPQATALISASSNCQSASVKPAVITRPEDRTPNTSRRIPDRADHSPARAVQAPAPFLAVSRYVSHQPARAFPEGKDDVREPERLRRSGPPDENGGTDHDTHHAQTGGIVH